MGEVVLDIDGAAGIALARRAVVELVAELGGDVVDDVRLAVSEVVSNAILHGLPPVRLHARRSADALRVVVADGNTAVGSPQHPSASATSGRGLAIVDAVVARWGFEARSGGKALWMEFDLVDDGGATSGPLRSVVLLGVPIDVYLRGQEHLEDILHELRVMAASDEEGFDVLEEETAMPLREALDTFRGSREAGRAEAMAAASGGEATVDFTWELAPEAGPAAQAWAVGVAQLDELARAGTLLTPPADDEVARLRRWLAAEVAAQLAGGGPTRFPPSTGG